MSIFRPPTDDFVVLGLPPKDFDSQEARLAYSLFRHFDAEPRGRNVFLLTNGTFTENEPNDNTTITRVYFGGSDNEVSASEVASLTAAGYGEYIS
jgi:hypothetical protein